jgi:hypothetical protein
VTTVVTKGNGFSERDVEPHWSSDARRHLGDLECVRETRSHVVVGKNEDLCLARKATKSARVKYSVTVALEAGSKLVRLFFSKTVAPAATSGRTRGHERIEQLFALKKRASERRLAFYQDADARRRVFVSNGDVVTTPLVAAHGCGPAPCALGDGFSTHVSHLAPTP